MNIRSLFTRENLYSFLIVLIFSFSAVASLVLNNRVLNLIGVPGPIFFLGLIFVALGLLFVLRWPELGVYLVLALLPVEIILINVAGYGMFLFQPVVMVTLSVILVKQFVAVGKIRVPKALSPIIILWVTYGVSIFFAIELDVTVGGVAFFVPIIATCWMLGLVARERQDLEKYLIFSIWVGVAIAVIGIIQTAGNFIGIDLTLHETQVRFLELDNRPSSLQVEPNWFGIYTGMILVLAVPFWLRGGKLNNHPVRSWMLGVLMVGILLSGTRSAWVGLLFAVVLLGILNYRTLGTKIFRGGGILILTLLGVMVLMLLVPRTLEPLTRLSRTFDAGDSTSRTRINTWLLAIDYIEERPLTGYGFSAWEVISADYDPDYYTGINIIDGKSVANIFLDNWVSGGILSFFAILFLTGYYLFHLTYFLIRSRDQWENLVTEALLGGWLFLLSASFFTNAFRHNWFWIVPGLTIAFLSLRNIQMSRNYSFEHTDG